MKRNRKPIDRDRELKRALRALAGLDVVVVKRCPVGGCPLCGPAVPIAA